MCLHPMPFTHSLAIVAAAMVTFTLQGCGGGGGGNTPPGPGPTPAPPTPPPGPAPPSKPLDGHVVAGILNKLYHGFNNETMQGPLGLYLTMQNEWFHYCGTPCYDGRADCRLSTALYNDKMLLTWQKHMRAFSDRPAGYVVNHTLVETEFGKCAYMFDGASDSRYNGGCGQGTNHDCKDPHSAYGNICPSSNKTCTVNDPEVNGASCKKIPILNWTGQTQCYFDGPAIDGAHVTGKNDFRDMVINRMYNQGKPGDPVIDPSGHSRLAYWNEVVVDMHVMDAHLNRDPAPVIPAFVYQKGNPQGIPIAASIRAEFIKLYPVPGTIPLIAMNTTQDEWAEHDGPFSFEEKDQPSQHQVIL